MFDPLLDLRRRRMQQSGLPEIQGNVQIPQVGPDMMAQNVQPPMPVMQPMPFAGDGPNLSGLSQLGAERGMGLLLKRLKPTPNPEEGQKAMAGLPVLKKLFHR